MSTNVLVLESPRDGYGLRLQEAFSSLSVSSNTTADGADIALSDVDVLIAFGIDDQSLRRATRLAWIQALSTGVDQYVRSPSLRAETLLTNTRGIHGPAMRETVLFLMLALCRDAPRLFRQQMAHTWPALAVALRPGRGDRWRWRRRQRHRQDAEVIRHDYHRRQPHAP